MLGEPAEDTTPTEMWNSFKEIIEKIVYETLGREKKGTTNKNYMNKQYWNTWKHKGDKENHSNFMAKN